MWRRPRQPLLRPMTRPMISCRQGWSDDLVGVDATDRYEWRSKRIGTTGNWGKFQAPKLATNWSEITQDQIDALTLPRSAGWYFKFIDANTAVAIENLSETDAWPASAVNAANDATPGDNVAGDIVTIYRGEIASTRSWNDISMTWVAIASISSTGSWLCMAGYRRITLPHFGIIGANHLIADLDIPAGNCHQGREITISCLTAGIQ